MSLALDASFIQYIILVIIFHGLTVGGIYALVASSLTVVYGGLSFPNIALGSFLNVSCYIMYYLTFLYGLSFFPAMGVDMLLFFVIFVLLDRAIFRRYYNQANPAIIFLAVTLGLTSIINGFYDTILSSNAETVTTPYSAVKFQVGLFVFSEANVISLVVEYAMIFGLLYFMRYTTYGRALRAMTQDKQAAALMGANIGQLSTMAYLLSSMAAVAGGAMYALVFSFDSSIGGTLSFLLLAMVLIGGAGSVFGCTLVGLLYGFNEAIMTIFGNPIYAIFVFFGVLFVTLIFKPQGLFSK